MKALSCEKLPEGNWLYEIKHDGYRALAFKDGKDERLVSRNRNEFNYPELLDALKLLPIERVILDGEIAALDEKGRSSFQLLQLFKSSGDVPLVYYVFDLLFLERKDLRKEPLSARCKLLANLLKKPPENIRLSDDRADQPHLKGLTPMDIDPEELNDCWDKLPRMDEDADAGG